MDTATRSSSPGREGILGSSSGNDPGIVLHGPTGEISGPVSGSTDAAEGGGDTTPEEVVALAHGIYEGLTDEEIDEIEGAALDNSPWRLPPENEESGQ